MTDIENAIADVVALDQRQRLPSIRHEPTPTHDRYGGVDRLHKIAELIRSLPAEELWQFCNVMRRPELDKVLVAAAIAILEGSEFAEPAKIERRL